MDKQESKILSAAGGVTCLRTAVTAMRREPLALTGIALFYLIVMGVLSSIPAAGLVASSLFMPFGSVFLGRSTRTVLAGKTPSYGALGAIFQDKWLVRQLFFVGLVFGGVVITVNMLYGLLSAADVAAWKTDENDRLVWSSVAEHFPWTAMIAGLIIYIPGLMATWFSPLLVSEKRMSWAKSLFYSFFGCLKNVPAILVLGILLFTLITGFAAFALFVPGALGIPNAEIYLLVPLSMAACALCYATYWPLYEMLFGNVAEG